jgi:hypothetical protein
MHSCPWTVPGIAVDFSRIWKTKEPAGEGPGSERELPPALRAALADLDRQARPDAELESLRQKLESILKAVFSMSGTAVPSLAPEDSQTSFLMERIQEGWREGVPAVRVVSPVVDRDRLIERVKGLDACADRDYPAAQRFREVLSSEPERIADWAGVLLALGEDRIMPSLGQLGVEHNYALSTLRLALLGELGEWSDRATAQLSDSSWPRGDCPVCGASPALAESRGLEQRRFLRCDRCGAGWPCNRLQCPFCGEDDHRALRSLFAQEDQVRCRLVLCDGCGGRLKVITTLAPLSHPGLVVAQFTTLYLDFIDEESNPRESS